MKKIAAFLMLFVLGNGVVSAMDDGSEEKDKNYAVEAVDTYVEMIRTTFSDKSFEFSPLIADTESLIETFKITCLLRLMDLENLVKFLLEETQLAYVFLLSKDPQKQFADPTQLSSLVNNLEAYIDDIFSNTVPHHTQLFSIINLYTFFCFPFHMICFYRISEVTKHCETYTSDARAGANEILPSDEKTSLETNISAFKKSMFLIIVLHNVCTYYLSKFNNAKHEPDQTIRKIIYLCIKDHLLPSAEALKIAVRGMYDHYNTYDAFTRFGMTEEELLLRNISVACSNMISNLKAIIKSEKEKK